jgi:hypothetical protein
MDNQEQPLIIYGDIIGKAIQAIPTELREMDEEQLQEKLRPTYNMFRLKRSFWTEFTACHKLGKEMLPSNIYGGFVSKQYFYGKALHHHLLMAWIISPLVEYEDKVESLLDKATERYDELISAKITTTKRIKDATVPGGCRIVEEFDAKKGLVLLSVIKNLEDRVKGSAIQRQVSVSTKRPNGQGNIPATLDMVAVDRRLNELEKELGGINGDGPDARAVKFQPGDAGYIEAESRRIKDDN